MFNSLFRYKVCWGNKIFGKESIMMFLHIVICKAVQTKLHKSMKRQLLFELS